MGLFTKFRKMFDKNIDNDVKYDNEVVHLYSPSPAVFNIGYNIVVRPGFNAVIVAHDRVTDVLPSGKYRIGIESMPITYHKLKLDKLNKKRNPTKFRADLYFVNVNILKGIKFTSTVPYVNKSKEFGRVVAYSEGDCTVKIEEAGDIMSYLLLDRAFVTNKQSLDTLAELIGNQVNKLLQKSSFGIKDIFKSPKSAGEYCSNNIGASLESFGITVSEINLKYFDISSKVQKKLGESIDEEKTFVTEYLDAANNNTDDDSTSQVGGSLEDFDPKFVVENNVEVLTTPSNDNAEYVVQPTNEGNAVEDNSTSDSSDAGIITCPSCGEKIGKSSKFCSNCGFKLDSIRGDNL